MSRLLMHACNRFTVLRLLTVSSYQADIRRFMQVVGLEYCPNYGEYHCIVPNHVVDRLSCI